MNYLVKPGTLAKPSGKLFPDGLVSERLIGELSCETGGVGQTIREVIPRCLVRGRLIHQQSFELIE